MVKKGLYFALTTAVISGFAIFLNSFAVKKFSDPYFFTFSKNTLVAFLLTGSLIGLKLRKKLTKLTPKQWLQLVTIGLIGGSLPFLLFFRGLSLATASSAAFIHKTLFLWVAILAVVFLKERLNRWQLLALMVLIVGNFWLVRPRWEFGSGEFLVLLATELWAVENILAKIALRELAAPVVAWGRMFFGIIFMGGFLATTGRLTPLFQLTPQHWWWLLGLAALLFGYVSFWYAGLKYAPATLVTSVLVLGSPLTTLLSAIFVKHSINWQQLLIFALLVLAVVVLVKNFKLSQWPRYSLNR